MWKCPSCGAMNSGEVCAGCGLEKKSYSRYRPQMSGIRLILAIIASFLVIALLFFAVNAAIDQRNRRRARESGSSYEASETSGDHFS